MKNFVFGLICGISITALFLTFNNESDVAPQPIIEFLNESDTEQPPKLEQDKIKEIPVSEPERSRVEEKKADETVYSQEVANELDDSDDLQGKAKIIGMLNNFNTKDLARIESILKHLNDKTPSERFDSESIDTDWSLKKQTELEYTFYEQSALKDLGTLESIRCKSKTCQVKVEVPAGLKLKPSHYMDWSNPVSVSINPSQDNSNFSTIEIYISREQ